MQWIDEDYIRAYIVWFSAILQQLKEEEREEMLSEN